MVIPTEPVGSVPRPDYLLDAFKKHGEGALDADGLHQAVDRAVAETVVAMEATGSPVITDGEQSKPSFRHLSDRRPGEPGARRRGDPLRRRAHAAAAAADGGPLPLHDLFRDLRRPGPPACNELPIKQAVIAPSALSLLYPAGRHRWLPARAFIEDLITNARRTSARPSMPVRSACRSISPKAACPASWIRRAALLRHFVALNNAVLDRFDAESAADRSPYLPGRRSRFHALGRCRLCRAAAGPLRHQGRPVLHPDGERGEPARVLDLDRARTPAGSDRLHRRHRSDRRNGRERRDRP